MNARQRMVSRLRVAMDAAQVNDDYFQARMQKANPDSSFWSGPDTARFVGVADTGSGRVVHICFFPVHPERDLEKFFNDGFYPHLPEGFTDPDFSLDEEIENWDVKNVMIGDALMVCAPVYFDTKVD